MCHARRIFTTRTTQFAVVAAAATGLVGGPADVHGQFFRAWTNASGGSYADPFNWNPAGVPNINDGAGFSLGSVYTVVFPANQTTGVVTVSGGSVTFDLNTSGTARTLAIPGTLTVRGSTTLSVRDGTVAAGNILVENIGALFGATTATIGAADGSVTVRGPGSIWQTQNGFLRVGESGTGTLRIEDGGRIINDDGAAIGRFAGSDGTATVTGNNSLLDVDANLTVGQDGTGALRIEDGGKVESVLGRIAFDADAVGTATVTGVGSTWTVGDELRIGESGDGTLSIEAGGSVSNTNGFIGQEADAFGTRFVAAPDCSAARARLPCRVPTLN
mgnify:CR=1 FL=1